MRIIFYVVLCHTRLKFFITRDKRPENLDISVYKNKIIYVRGHATIYHKTNFVREW